MLSKSNFAAVALVMAAVFLLFQFTGVSTSALNRGETNPYAGETAGLPSRESAEHTSFSSGKGKEKLLLVTGGAETETARRVREEAAYLKRECESFETAAAAASAAGEDSVVAVVGSLSWKQELTALRELTGRGVPVLVLEPPEASRVSASRELREYLGVDGVEEERTATSGLRLFQGFFLGGETVYDDYALEPPYYRLKPGSRVYAAGLFADQEEREIKNEELPALVWRYSQGDGAVYVCALPFLEDQLGMGFLTGLLCQLEEYAVYPVVNAQMVLLENFPYLSRENDGEMQRRYSQSADQFFQEKLWPSAVSILRSNGDKATCFLSPTLDYSLGAEPDGEKLDFFMGQLAREGCEAGVSGTARSGWAGKLEADFSFYGETVPQYVFTAFSTGGMPEEYYRDELASGGLLETVRTLVRPAEELEQEELLSYYRETVLQLPGIFTAEEHSQEDDLRLRSLESALAFSSIRVDLSQIVYPEGDEDDWVRLGVDWARFSDTYWKPFRSFDSVLVSEGDRRTRLFLALDYRLAETDRGVEIQLDGFGGEAWFLFRSAYQRPAEAVGGTVMELEEGVYLVHAERETVELVLEPVYGLHYTD